MKKKHTTIFIAILLAALSYSCTPHPSSQYEYYKELQTRWIPTVKGKLICEDTTLIVYRMEHATAGIYNIWWITEE